MSSKPTNSKDLTIKPIISGLAKPVVEDQQSLFSNMLIGVEASEIVARHQFFDNLYKSLYSLGETELWLQSQKASNRHKELKIPLSKTGSSSAYTIKIPTTASIGGVDKALIATPTDAKRFTARVYKTQNLLYLWAVNYNTFTITNTKTTDLLKLAGFEGRIKTEHYIDITVGLYGLYGMSIDRTDDKSYTDPTSGKVIKLKNNELYGETIHPVGQIRAVWHSVVAKDDKGKPIIDSDTGEPKKVPLYIKKIVKLVLAEGMLSPTSRRATIADKGIIKLNTLQERHISRVIQHIYMRQGQYQEDTAKGLPIKVSLTHYLKDWRGNLDSENLARPARTLKSIKNTLDKAVELGSIASWKLKDGDYNTLKTLTASDLKRVILIYPSQSTTGYKLPNITTDKAVISVLKNEYKNSGITEMAERYHTKTANILDVINGKDTADSLPKDAYNEILAKAYTKDKATKKPKKVY